MNPYVLVPRDGFTIKDPRGFNAAGGVTGKTLPWPLPPTVAGAARTAIGAAHGWLAPGAQSRWPALLHDVSCRGPLAVARTLAPHGNWQPLFPCPRDVLAFGTKDQPRFVWLEPQESPGDVSGTWSGAPRTPMSRATEALLRPSLGEKGKPLDELPAWWSDDDALKWLLDPIGFQDPRKLPATGWLPKGRHDMHLAIEAQTRTAKRAHLFGLEVQETLAGRGRDARRELGIYLRMERGAHPAPANLWRFGGESQWAALYTPPADPWQFPADTYRKSAPKTFRRFRLLLLTPAIFANGWLPDGFTPSVAGPAPTFGGRLAALPDTDLTLRSAFVPRAGALSGWDYVADHPKASRLFVPPGAVYYFEASRDLTHTDLQQLWLATLQPPASQEARDGFGLVVPGLWPDSAPT